MRWKTDEYTGWGRVLKASGALARPEKMAELRTMEDPDRGPAIGNLRSYGDAALNSGGRAIAMTRLDRLIEFDEDTGLLTAEAGISIGEIMRIFAPRGWIPAVVPGTGIATLGGCICNDVHGKNHHGAGSFGQHVTAIELLGAGGNIRTIKPDTNKTLFRATVGGLGQTGIILSATIKLAPATSEVMDVQENRADNLDEFMVMLEQSSATYSVGWIDAAATGTGMGRGILEEAEIKEACEPLKTKKPKSVGRDAPKFFLSPPVVRLFNRFYLNRVPVAGRRLDRAQNDFFFPLDRIHNWNRLYGKSGFHQFQCVVPDDTANESLTRMLTSISRSKLASPLAVLKRLGEGRAGMMSFPMKGYTLAVDFPNRAKSAALVQELEDEALNAGGRVYLAKDALSRAGRIRSMYDEQAAFTKQVLSADPEGIFTTDMARRLKLRGEP